MDNIKLDNCKPGIHLVLNEIKDDILYLDFSVVNGESNYEFGELIIGGLGIKVNVVDGKVFNCSIKLNLE